MLSALYCRPFSLFPAKLRVTVENHAVLWAHYYTISRTYSVRSTDQWQQPHGQAPQSDSAHGQSNNNNGSIQTQLLYSSSVTRHWLHTWRLKIWLVLRRWLRHYFSVKHSAPRTFSHEDNDSSANTQICLMLSSSGLALSDSIGIGRSIIDYIREFKNRLKILCISKYYIYFSK